MRRMRLALALTLALASWSLVLAACGDDDTEPAATPDTQADVSADVADTTADAIPDTSPPVCENPCLDENGKNDKRLCPTPLSDWICTAGCCIEVFKCQTDDDCRTHGFTEGQCTDTRFDCHCDVETAVCFAFYCSANSDCDEGKVCSAGSCVDETAAEGLSIRILNRPTILTQGASVSLLVEAYDPADVNVVAPAEVSWASDAEGVASVTSGGVVTGGDTEGSAIITATLSGSTATTSYTVRNVIAATGDTLTVVTADELSMAPTAARYAIIKRSDGSVVESGDVDGSGVIRSTVDLTGGVDLHIFGAETDWVSWLGVDQPTMLFLPLPRTLYSKVNLDLEGAVVPEDTVLRNVGIIKGEPDWSEYTRPGGLEVSLTSFALGSAIFDFSLPVLLGSDVKRFLHPDANIPRVDTSQPIEVPGGITFGLAGPAIPSFVLTAPAGKPWIWSMGGRLDLTEVAEFSGDIIDAVTGDELDFTKIVGAIFPLFKIFNSGITNEVAITTIEDAGTVVDAAPKLAMPLGLETAIDVPPLPRIADLGWADGVIILGGALTGDGFLLPMGLDGGSDTTDEVSNPPDGIADAKEYTEGKDPFLLRLAPLHSGLQGPHSAYAAAIVAVAIPGRDDPRPDAGAGILVYGEPGAALPGELQLSEFLGLPTDSTWDATTRALRVGTVDGADVQRVLFKGKKGEHWTLWTTGTTDLNVPVPADLFADLGDRATNEVANVWINSLAFEGDITLDAVAAPGGVTLDNLLGTVVGLSFIDVRKPIFPTEGE